MAWTGRREASIRYRPLHRWRGISKGVRSAIAYPGGIDASYTNDFVYARLAPGVLAELRRKNPKLPAGYRKSRHHQWFTPDFGDLRLKEHLAGVMALMRAAPNWTSFYRSLQRAYPKMREQIPLALGDDE